MLCGARLAVGGGDFTEMLPDQFQSLNYFDMKAYLVTTGLLFGLMAVVHVWRAIAEWPHPTVDLGFVLGMGALIAIPGVLAWWAWRCLRSLSKDQTKRGNKKDSND
jgi:hypothetical protein